VSFKEHDAIIAAIKARDADQAASAMLAHLRSVRERVLPMLILRDVGDRRTLFEQQAAPAR
jgi:DNA-binding FadR family transcriptional regulator